MSLPVSNVTRTPLKDISSSLQHVSKSGTPHQSYKPVGSTPKTSPGPALLHGIRLSAKKNLPKISYLANTTNCVTKLQDSTHDSASSERVLLFRKLLDSETKRITEVCCYWDKILQDSVTTELSTNVPGDFILGEIRSTIGQARLIMKERFYQFEGLVDNCEFQTSEKIVTCQDLQGFWDMVYFQVEDVDKKFMMLKNCQSCNWNESSLRPEKEPSPVKKVKKKILNKPIRAKSSAAKSKNEEMAKKRAEARKRLQAAKAEMKKANSLANQKTFDAGPFFKIESPVKSPRKKVESVNTSFEYFASKPDTAITCPAKPLCENVPQTGCNEEVQLPSEKSKPLVTTNESPVHSSSEMEFSLTHRSTIGELPNQRSPVAGQNANDLVTVNRAALCPVDASGDDFPAGFVSETGTPKNISRLSILSANVSPWSDISMSEIERETMTTLHQDLNNDGTASSSLSNDVYPSSHKSEKMKIQNLSPKDVTSLPIEVGQTSMPCVLSSPLATCSSSQIADKVYDNIADEEVHTMLTPFQRDVSVLIGTAAKNIEMASAQLLNETPQRQAKDIRARSLVDQGTSFSPQDVKNEESMVEALQKILKHMAIFQDLSEHHLMSDRPATDQTDVVIQQMQDQIKALKIKNAELQKNADEPLTCEEVVQYLYNTTEMPDTPDILYKPHYLRLLTKKKMLEIELSQYEKCGQLLEEKAKQMHVLVDRLNVRKNEVDTKECELADRFARCQKIENTENEELVRNRAELKELKMSVAEKEDLMVHMAAQIEQQIPLIKELKERNEFLETESSNLKQDYLEQTSRIKDLHADLEKFRHMHQTELERADELQSKFDMMNKEVYCTFQEFEATLEERNNTVARQEKQLEELNSANANFNQTIRQLEDRVETLEYVEDEMRTLQEQLLETENILSSSKLNEKKAEEKIADLTNMMAQRDVENENLRVDCTLLQEKCDVVQTEAAFSVQKSKEELLDGITGVGGIVEQMKNFLSRLKAAAEESCTNAINTIQSSSPTQNPEHVVKDEDSMSWKVDQACSVFLSIVKECSELNVKFRKYIEKLEGEKAACRKQIDDMKMALSDGVRKESELEGVLRKRIATLSKECEEKAVKLEDQVKAMRILSDQNVELLEYRMKHQVP